MASTQTMRIGLSQCQVRSSRFKNPFMVTASGSLISDSFLSSDSNSQNFSQTRTDVSSTVTESISICDSSDTFGLESEFYEEEVNGEEQAMSPVIVSRRSPVSAKASKPVGLENTGRTTATTVQLTSLPVPGPMSRQSATAQNRSKPPTSLRKINPAPRIKKAGCISLSKWKTRLELLDLIAKMGREIKQIKAKAALRKKVKNNGRPTEPPQASMKRKLTLNENLFDGEPEDHLQEALEEDKNGGTETGRGSDRPKLVVKARAKRPRKSVGIALNECRFMEE